mgnify:CR=1 FL=1
MVNIADCAISVCLCSPPNINYSVDKRSTSNLSKISKAIPPPFTTQVKGSSATITGIPVCSEIIMSKSVSKAPPPVKTIHLSEISALSSGGDCSSAFLID